jgi:hypothetical protein
MTLTNSQKSQHGQSAQDSLEFILLRCKKLGYIKDLNSNYRIGKVGYNNTVQFYAPFVITFNDDSMWALFTTTSMRTDRIKGQQWDAINLKQITPQIKAVYLVYPDGVTPENKARFIRQNSKYSNHDEYSAIDEIVSQDKISNMIEDYALKDKCDGQIKDIQGNNFEYRIATILSYPENLTKWKTNAPTMEGMHYDVFKTIVDCFELPKTTAKISATSDKKDIGKLPTNGNPKTDVLVTVTTDTGEEIPYTISCKRSSDKSVSVHQYTATAFADVLDKDNVDLRVLLEDFQTAGSVEAFGIEQTKRLTNTLAPYIEKLARWVLGGVGGSGDPDTQWAKYILTYDNNDGVASIHKLSEYCQKILSDCNGQFGTPFSWTYPSKRRGESIQLKCKILK